jgi:hypothetical protein
MGGMPFICGGGSNQLIRIFPNYRLFFKKKTVRGFTLQGQLADWRLPPLRRRLASGI